MQNGSAEFLCSKGMRFAEPGAPGHSRVRGSPTTIFFRWLKPERCTILFCFVQSTPFKNASGQNRFDEFTRYIRQAEIAALGFDGESLVIDAEQVQQGRVKIVDGDDVFNRVVTEVVG